MSSHPLPFLVHGEFSPAMACSPPPPALVEMPVQRIAEARGEEEGSGCGVMPWSLHSYQTSSLGLSEERQLSKCLPFLGRGTWKLAKMELLGWGDDPELQRASIHLHVISIIDYV